MKETKIRSLGARKKFKRKKKTRLVTNIVAYFKSDGYLFTTEINTPLPSLKAEDISMAGFEKVVIKKKRRMWEKVKEYLKSHCYMYEPMISRLRSLKGNCKSQTMEVSTSTTTMKEDIVEHNGRISSPKRAVVILARRTTNWTTP